MYHPAPAVVAAPPAAAPAAGGAAGNARRRAGCWWQPVTSSRAMARAQVGMAVAAFAFALFASAIKPAHVITTPATSTSSYSSFFVGSCVTTAADVMKLRYYAGLLLLSAAAQAGAAATALVITPPHNLSGFLAGVANVLGIATLARLFQVAPRVLSATGAFCLFTGHVLPTELAFHVAFAGFFICAVPFFWIFGHVNVSKAHKNLIIFM